MLQMKLGMVGSALLPTCTYASTVRSSYLTSILGNSMFTLEKKETGKEDTVSVFQNPNKSMHDQHYRQKLHFFCFIKTYSDKLLSTYACTLISWYKYPRAIYCR